MRRASIRMIKTSPAVSDPSDVSEASSEVGPVNEHAVQHLKGAWCISILEHPVGGTSAIQMQLRSGPMPDPEALPQDTLCPTQADEAAGDIV